MTNKLKNTSTTRFSLKLKFLKTGEPRTRKNAFSIKTRHLSKKSQSLNPISFCLNLDFLLEKKVESELFTACLGVHRRLFAPFF